MNFLADIHTSSVRREMSSAHDIRRFVEEIASQVLRGMVFRLFSCARVMR